MATPPANWEDVFKPSVLRSFNVELKRSDWDTIRADLAFETKVPATFWLDGDEVVDVDSGELVPTRRKIEIRRKSATAIGDKISYRLKFTESLWCDLQTLSLENGDDNNVVTEGLSWYLHRLASTTTYRPGLAAWSKLTLHLVSDVEGFDEFGEPVLTQTVEILPQGVYLNVEFVDALFLAHRGLWDSANTWLYKQDDIGLPEIKGTPDGSHSPAYAALDYSPFQATRLSGKRVLNPTPIDPALEQDLNLHIDMDSMLRLGAVNAFTDNPDELFNKGKNFFWADFTNGRRQYFPWDLDASIRSTSAGIYGTVSVTKSRKGTTTTVSQHPYQKIILNHPKFRSQYNNILTSLLSGPLRPELVANDLTAIEIVLTDALIDDTNNQIGNDPDVIHSYFDYLRTWISLRAESVYSQIQNNNLPVPRGY